MKVIVDIDDSYYKVYKTSDKNNIDLSIGELAIKNGIAIPDNATIGDVIKAMFPNLEIKYTDIDEYTNEPRFVNLIIGNTIIARMSVDRWNAPYKENIEEKTELAQTQKISCMTCMSNEKSGCWSLNGSCDDWISKQKQTDIVK